MKIALLIVMLFVSNLSADFFSDANQAYKNGDYKKSSELMEKACDGDHENGCTSYEIFKDQN